MAHNSGRAYWIAGVWRCEFNEYLVFRLQFQSGKDQHASFADVVGPAFHDTCAVLATGDQAYREIETIALPPPKNTPFLRRVGIHWFCGADARLCCHVLIITAVDSEAKVTEVPACRFKPDLSISQTRASFIYVERAIHGRRHARNARFFILSQTLRNAFHKMPISSPVLELIQAIDMRQLTIKAMLWIPAESRSWMKIV
jgi:hypothetical protein